MRPNIELCSHRLSTLDVHAYPGKFEEFMIVFDEWKCPVALANYTKSYAEDTSSSVHFLIVDNERIAKEL